MFIDSIDVYDNQIVGFIFFSVYRIKKLKNYNFANYIYIDVLIDV